MKVSACKYIELAEKADDETAIYSSISLMLKNESVQAIIQMDKGVLSFLFRDLMESRGIHWRMAVINIILADNDLSRVEIPDEFRGKVREMQRLYIEYGKRHGWIWQIGGSII